MRLDRRTLRILGAAAALAVAALAIRSLIRAWQSAARQPVAWHVSPGWIAVAGLVAVVTYLVLIETWRRTAMGYGQRADFSGAARVWILSNFGKYFGSLGIAAGMAVLAPSAGLTSTVAVTAAVIVQALSLATGVALSAALAWGAIARLGPAYTVGALLIGAAAVAGVVLLHSSRALERLRTLLPERVPTPRAASISALGIGIGGNALAWGGYGLVMVLLARGLFATPAPTLAEATSAYTVSYLVGLLAIFVPAGLGLREAIFTALLAPTAGVEVAAALALASRVLLTAVEFAIALPFALRRTTRPDAPSLRDR